MGIDYLDMTLRTERAFGIKISREQSDEFLRDKIAVRDFTTGQWFDFVWKLRQEQFPDGIECDRPCFHCGYNLRGLPTVTTCPECGGGSDQAAAWKAMQRIYRQLLGKKARRVGRDAWMVKELGFS